MVDAKKFDLQLMDFCKALSSSKRVLITAPGAADGDSLGSQLALRRMINHRYPQIEVRIINDEKIPERYLFLPTVDSVDTPETILQSKVSLNFDVGCIVDGGIDRAGRVREAYDRCKTRVFIDHHVVSVDYPYSIRIVEPTASSTTELIYHLSQTNHFGTPVDKDFSQFIYLGLIFDTGFFRHSNTTAEAMELERTFSSLQLLSYTLSRAQLRGEGKIIWATMTRDVLNTFHSTDDDREGIIDHLFLTHGIEVAVLFFELPESHTKVSFRSQGKINVAQFARLLTERGGGHEKAAGANLDMPIEKATQWVLTKLEEELARLEGRRVLV